MTRWPAVTVIVSTFNQETLLPRALQSILDQTPTFTDFEVLIVDDASTDGTGRVIEEWASRFDGAGIPFNAFRLAENSGYQAVPKNRAIEFARGDYIRFLDDDNEWTPGSLKALVDCAEDGDTWPDGTYGRREYVFDEGSPRVTSTGLALPEGPTAFVPWSPERLAAGSGYNYIDTSDFILSRGAFWWLYEHTGMMWNESWRRFGDWELLCRGANLDKLVEGATPLRMRAVDAIVSRYHWTGKNLQLTRPAHEVPMAQSGTTGELFGKKVG